MKTRRLMQNDANIQTLMRIYVHHAGSQIHSEYSESIAHMCFANSLSAQSWMNIHPSIEERIYEMNPNLVQDIQLENLEKLRNRPLFGLFRSLEEQYADFQAPWTSPQPLPLLRLSPISFAIKDAIKPLNPEVRAHIERPELIQRALQTATGSRELMVAILMIRQFREFIPAEAEVSRAIVDSLLNLDGRVHISIFHEACRNIGGMPATIARQFLLKLARIIQEDGEIGLLDALLLERVKFELNLLPVHTPAALDEVKPQIVRLIDALLHVQQINSETQLLQQSDFIVVAVDLNAHTQHLIDAEAFKKMQSHAVFVNISRGAVVDEQALIQALEQKQIFAAGLDVYEKEPLQDSVLFQLHNVVTLPHIGSATSVTRKKMAELAYQNLVKALEGGQPQYVVNPEFR